MKVSESMRHLLLAPFGLYSFYDFSLNPILHYHARQLKFITGGKEEKKKGPELLKVFFPRKKISQDTYVFG